MKESLGKQIRKFRVRAKLSQIELENNISAAVGYISKVELDKIKPTKTSLDKIIKVLNLTPLESTSLYDINTQFIYEFINIINNFNKAKTVGELFKIYADNVNKLFNFNGGAIYFVEDNLIKINMMSDEKNINLAKMIVKIPENSIQFDITKDEMNPIVEVYKTQQYKIVFDLHEIMGKFIPRAISNLAQKLSNSQSIIIIPLVYEGKCIALVVFGKLIKDNFEHEIELFTAINNVAAECLYNIIHKN